jgi:hypothetical protein
MRSERARRWWGVPAACGVALALRLGFVLWQDPYRHADETDYGAYLAQAEHMLAHASGPEDTFMPFGLSAWIALGRALRMPAAWLPLWQVAASVATVALAGVAARRIAGSERAGAAAAWLAALYAPFLYYVGFLFTETTTAALVAAAIAVAAGGLARPRDRAAAGLALGVAAVWRTNVILVPVAWAIGALVAGGVRRWRSHPSASVLAWAAAPVALAALRASILVGAPTGPATNGAVNFLLAHSDWTEVRLPYVGADDPGGTRVIHFFRNRRRAQEAVYQASEPVFRERPLYREAWRAMKDDPVREARRLPLALLDGVGLGREGYYPRVFWYSRLVDGDAVIERLRAPIGLLVVLPALAWAVLRGRRRGREALSPGEGLLLATLAGAFVTFALFLSEPRMRLPFDPAFVVASVLAWRAVARWRWWATWGASSSR